MLTKKDFKQIARGLAEIRLLLDAKRSLNDAFNLKHPPANVATNAERIIVELCQKSNPRFDMGKFQAEIDKLYQIMKEGKND